MKKYKNKCSIWLCLLLLPICFSSTMAQSNRGHGFYDTTVEQIVLPESNTENIEFWPEVDINPLSFIDDYKTAFGLSVEDKMHLLKTKTDELGYTHYTLSQYYRNIKVDQGIYIMHVNDQGKAYSGNGHLISGLNNGTVPVISLSQAREKAMQYSGAKIFLWENDEYENRLKLENRNADTTYFPKGELIWAISASKEFGIAENYELAYTFDVHCYSPLKSLKITVSAVDGTLLKQEDYSHHCTQLNNAPNPFYTNTTVFIQWTGSTYRLYDDCQTGYIWVRDWNSSTTTPNAVELTDVAGTNWNSQVKTLGTATLWGLEKSRNYFSDYFARNGWNNNNGSINAYVNARFDGDNCAPWPFTESNEDNASFNAGTGVCKVGSGCYQSGNIDSWAPIDVLGHEFTHGVTGTSVSGGLTYQGESGALNESFSDIFGEMIENYSLSGGCDYLEGADRLDTWGSPDPIRSISNPNAFNDPDTYNGTYWTSTSSGAPDNGGVHTNSGVQNYFFYLLAEGGSGTNDNGNSFSVSGIGKTAAAAIAYRALDVYFTSSSNYANARTHWVQAAKDLYGNCSNQVYQTAKAWYAVGVGSSPPVYNTTVCGNLTGTTYSGVVSLGTCGSGATAPSGVTANMTASEVVLSPGFTASNGCNFRAYVTACSSVITRPMGGSGSYFAKAHRATSKHTYDNPSIGNNKQFVLSPNPFIHTFNLEINLNEDAQVSVSIYDLTGKEIDRVIQNQTREKGLMQLQYNNEKLTPGIYFCVISIDGIQYTEKIVKM